MKKEKKERRKPSLGTAVMWRVVTFVMGAWLICMGYLTAMVARSTYLDYVDQVNAYVQRDGLFDYDVEKDEIENYAAKIRGIRGFDPDAPEMDIPLYSLYMRCTRFIPRFNWDWPDQAAEASEQWSVTLYDGNKQQIMGKNDYVYLTYRDYYNGGYAASSRDYLSGYTYIDLNRTECGQAMIEEWKGQNGFSDSQGFGGYPYRLTGYFDGNEFILLKVERDHQSFVTMPDWRSLYDGEIEYEGDTVVIYPAEMCFDRCDVQVSLENWKWELEDLGASFSRSFNTDEKYGTNDIEKRLSDRSYSNRGFRKFLMQWNSNNLFEAVIARSGRYLDENGESCKYVAVLRVQPIRIAMSMLVEVYLLTLIPVVLVLFFFCRRIRRELMAPLGHILRYPNMDQAAPLYRMTPKYRESIGLLRIFNQAQQDIHELKTENTRLATALDYAHHAEENRRRMVSNITHELKTPLAVIHSYAEGLKEGIAADGQEHYLDVILEESERMDAMVLEMLDLSRLEAGKVRLESNRFSLLELIHRVFDKLNLLVEEKQLKVEYVLTQDFEITADEDRMAQALTNLVSNAIKYSPLGGMVYVSVIRAKDQAVFSIENQSEPLSEETLSSIWDSFYRADSSRTEKGTGLGLPITKAIIELHGGTCHVANTATGVEFKLLLP